MEDKMNDNRIYYAEKLNKLFSWFENNKFEPEYNDKGKEINREFNLVCQFSDWLNEQDIYDLAELCGMYADFKDPDDVNAAMNKLLVIADKGINSYLEGGKWWNK